MSNENNQAENETQLIQVLHEGGLDVNGTNRAVVAGWDAVADALDHEVVGAYVRLADREKVHFTPIGAPASYLMHRVPKMDQEIGRPITDRFGKVVNELVLCQKVYGDGDCANCAQNRPTTRRTIMPVAIWRLGAGDVRQRPVIASTLEQGPTVWKMQLMPLFQEHGRNALVSMQRLGQGTDTKYTIVPVMSKPLTPAERQEVQGLTVPNLLEVMRIGSISDAE